MEQLVVYQERFPGPAHEKGEPQQIPPADCDGLPEFGQKPRNMGDDSLSMSSGPCPAPTVRITETQQNRGVLQILAQSLNMNAARRVELRLEWEELREN